MSQYWSCFIDESGDLDDRDDVVLLAGVLLPTRDDPFLMARLREAMRRDAPLVPWPFHRWIATKPSIYPFWREQRPEEELEASVDDACRRAFAAWEKRRPELLRKVRKVCHRGEEPKYTQMRSLRRALKKEDYAAFDQLRRYSERICTVIARRPAKLVEAKGCDRPVGLLFMAGEGGGADDNGEERYFQLLALLLERVRDVLMLNAGEQVVTVEAASRYVPHPSLPSKPGRPAKLTRGHLAEACKRVQLEPEGDEFAPRIRLTAGSVSDYGDDVSPGLVVADGAANFLRRKLLRTPRLRDLHSAVQGYFRLPLCGDEPALSYAAATNAPANAVELARRQQFDEARQTLEKLERQWPKEQAVQWVQFFDVNGEERT